MPEQEDFAAQTEYNNKLVKIAGRASICVAIFLVILKFYALWETNSIAILSGLMDSLLDFVASAINFFAIKWAITPADEDHRFGHGKSEALAGLAQCILIATSAILLMVESVYRFYTPEPITHFDLGIGVTCFTIIVTLCLIIFQNYVIRRTSNLAIKADAMHYKNDIFLNAGILIALIATYYTDILHIDAIISFCVACIIIWGIRDIMKQSFDQIMDKEFSDEKREKIFRLAVSHDAVKDIHDLRTRTSGSGSFIQFHLELPPETRLYEAHKISDEVEKLILQGFPEAEIFIHLDPEGHPKENPLPYTIH
ncbi:MAG: cation diffusion facilitator family transporter [Pseudomonadota bacterium]